MQPTTVTYLPDSTLFESGQVLDSLGLIIKGSVQASFSNYSIQLNKGDVIGISEICLDSHVLTYKSQADTLVMLYPFSGIANLTSLLSGHADLASLFLLSTFRQIHSLFQCYKNSKEQCNALHKQFLELWKQYLELCAQYHVAPQALPGMDEFITLPDKNISHWILSYYNGLLDLTDNGVPAPFLTNTNVLTGMIMKGSRDFYKAISLFDSVGEYRSQLLHFFMNEEELDLFDFLTSLLHKAGRKEELSLILTDLLAKIIAQVREAATLSPELIHKRMADYQSQLALTLSASQTDKTQQYQELTDSLYTILDYAGLDAENAVAFRELLLTYRNAKDRNASDDASRTLRLKLTKHFHEIYKAVVHKSFTDTQLPVIIRMFLTFGYMDEELAGMDNACYLHTLCQHMPTENTNGVYTFYQWLCAIYHGEKEPGRNDFDEDYQQSLHSLKAGRKITDAEFMDLSNDTLKKVDYELDNFFRSVNKMTYGQISSYCPVFSEQNVLKSLEKSYLNSNRIIETLNHIRELDYSAFYRESIYANPAVGVPKELIHVEILPDVILMPVAGIRGVMWQEIEGRKRTTPSRMALPVFQMENLLHIMLRMTAEYRWEMCKRIQGARWNDLGDPSLTSEYVDYIQFYRKNHELSTDAKEKVKSSLQKNKNNFKEMFIQDYLLWMLYESSGSPRLNKVSRGILFTYCPFPSAIRDTLSTNPLYQELLNRFLIKRRQKLHHLENLLAKVKNSAAEIPDELAEEYEYIKK